MITSPSFFEITSLALGVLALGVGIFAAVRIFRLERFQKKFFSGRQAADLEQLILTHDDRLGELSDKIKILLIEQKKLAAVQKLTVQKVGVVRFNAFADAGGNNSFAIALLDGENSGLVISSLYGRDYQRVYVKTIQSGGAALPLTGEEKQAILECRKPTSAIAENTQNIQA